MQEIFLDQEGVRTLWAKIKVELSKKVSSDILDSYMTDEEIEAAISAVLTDYATTDYVTRSIAAAIASVKNVRIEISESLPENGESNVIYFVPMKNPNDSNFYEEWVWINESWELIGTTQVDLSNYWGKTELMPITAQELEEILT